ncbi:hypothetical protein NDU88_000854 [Pleurodeles waltl]|uniref:Uncharacterized protein n=1 Tax=Pleurodeles waltl TaxID=8319 RepID=A0AAV7S855_PLEWA|nr:hypothetical protein NDU88_000854 [Pleurodeles waltl]
MSRPDGHGGPNSDRSRKHTEEAPAQQSARRGRWSMENGVVGARSQKKGREGGARVRTGLFPLARALRSETESGRLCASGTGAPRLLSPPGWGAGDPAHLHRPPTRRGTRNMPPPSPTTTDQFLNIFNFAFKCALIAKPLKENLTVEGSHRARTDFTPRVRANGQSSVYVGPHTY